MKSRSASKIKLVTGKSIHKDNLDQVTFMALFPIVHEALEKIVDAFPNFRYYHQRK